jgi:hypothetical protein
MDDDDPTKPVMDAANAAISGVQTAIEGLSARLDTIVATQAATLDHVVRLQPVKAVETEVGGSLDAIDPPTTEPNATTESESALRKFHRVIG